MIKKTLLWLSVASWFSLSAQTPKFSQQHKEIEYSYGVIADADIQTISEIERVKYEMKQVESTVLTEIDNSYRITKEINIEHSDYHQFWMTEIGSRFKYTNSGVQVYDKNNTLLSERLYTEDEATVRAGFAAKIEADGYHPGLPVFPEFNEELIGQLTTAGFGVKVLSEGVVELTDVDEVTTYDASRLTITRQWTALDGVLNIETDAYMPYEANKGFLPALKKHERFLVSENGPCITEVKLKYYRDYLISDNAGLIDQATASTESISLYPNPNNGLFTATIQVSDQQSISEVRIINLLTSATQALTYDYSGTINVDITAENAGHYVLQVITDHSAISTHFIKY